MTSNTVCSTVPEIRVLGLGIGLFLFILLLLLSISLILAQHDEGSKKSLSWKLFSLMFLYILVIIIVPKKSTGPSNATCGPVEDSEDSQGLLSFVVFLMMTCSTGIGIVLGLYLYLRVPMYAVTREDRATGHTTADPVKL